MLATYYPPGLLKLNRGPTSIRSFTVNKDNESYFILASRRQISRNNVAYRWPKEQETSAKTRREMQ